MGAINTLPISMQPEASFKRSLVAAFKKKYPAGWYGYTRLVVGNGLPDLRFAIPGKPGVWVEAKVGKGRLSAVQLRVCQKMVAAGEVVYTVTKRDTGLYVHAVRANGSQDLVKATWLDQCPLIFQSLFP